MPHGRVLRRLPTQQDAQARSEGGRAEVASQRPASNADRPEADSAGDADHVPVPEDGIRRGTPDHAQGAKTKPATPKSEPPQSTPGSTGTSATARTAPPKKPSEPERKPLRGAAAAIVKNMDASLEVPTATCVRAVPAKLMADNRIVINNFLKRNRGGKVSFTHLIGYAIVRALDDFPNMNRHFAVVDGKPHVGHARARQPRPGHRPARQGRRSGTWSWCRSRAAEAMTFTQFWSAYEDVVRKARTGTLTAEDYAGTTISLTNPGGIGTNHSVPRLMSGQGAIIGVGAMEYPAEFQGASEQTLSELGISKIMTLTSTYDHRIIQGAESGEFLDRIHQLLLGEDGFYDDVFTSLRLPYEPVRWVQDFDPAGRRSTRPPACWR